ncbi:uncharacterized protein LOC110037971 [Phalaenopsis equestris]|uniref:uncharacterized protein LOC110037971 n=1 Tax=Phalaenopsis equestris TaxID=78828 RepID=UPI0009E3BC57|nr:uncharacterized protein LOC110037971 [Phalaenopsis equestris]
MDNNDKDSSVGKRLMENDIIDDSLLAINPHKFDDPTLNILTDVLTYEWRKCNMILKITNSTGQKLTTNEEIAHDVVQYFLNMFTSRQTDKTPIKIDLFSDCLQYVEGINLTSISLKEEIKLALDFIDGQKAAGPDGGFNGEFINLIHRWLKCNAHSVLINGKCHGFFNASRGIKQGDPLSPTNFILALDYFSRLLNKLLLHLI